MEKLNLGNGIQWTSDVKSVGRNPMRVNNKKCKKRNQQMKNLVLGIRKIQGRHWTGCTTKDVSLFVL